MNEGTLDRIIRIALGVVLLAVSFVVTGWPKFVLLVGVIPLFTGIVGYCPLYTVLKIDTTRKER